MAAHPKQTKKAFNCKKCGHHRIDHNTVQGDGECFKCDCQEFK